MRRMRKIGEYALVRRVQPEEWFWIDFNGKMETRHPLEGSCGSEFVAICNHRGVIVAWIRKPRRWNFVRNFCLFGKCENDPLR